MLWFHPALQAFATMVGFYAAYLGMERFLSQHMGKRTQFLWKRHVTVGRMAILLWMAGLAGGILIARLEWQVNLITGPHFQTAFTMFPLMIVGAFTGIYMDRRKVKRTWLPLIHGMCNIVLLGLAFYQIKTGWQVIKDFIL